jgi:hypothetical protein
MLDDTHYWAETQFGTYLVRNPGMHPILGIGSSQHSVPNQRSGLANVMIKCRICRGF